MKGFRHAERSSCDCTLSFQFYFTQLFTSHADTPQFSIPLSASLTELDGRCNKLADLTHFFMLFDLCFLFCLLGGWREFFFLKCQNTNMNIIIIIITQKCILYEETCSQRTSWLSKGELKQNYSSNKNIVT